MLSTALNTRERCTPGGRGSTNSDHGRSRTLFTHTRADQDIGRVASDRLWREMPKEEAP